MKNETLTKSLSMLAVSVSLAVGTQVELDLISANYAEYMVTYKGEDKETTKKIAKYFKKAMNEVEVENEDGFTMVIFTL